MQFFSDNNNSLYNKLNHFYYMRKHNEIIYDKIIELLKITFFIFFNFLILELILF